MNSGNRLDIGIASYNSPDKLDCTLTALRQTCVTDWCCFVWQSGTDGGRCLDSNYDGGL